MTSTVPPAAPATEELTRQQYVACGPHAEDFLHVVAQARVEDLRDGGAALHEAYEKHWHEHRSGCWPFQRSDVDDAAARARAYIDDEERHGRGVVAFLLDELDLVSGAAHDAGLAALGRDLLSVEDYQLLSAAWLATGHTIDPRSARREKQAPRGGSGNLRIFVSGKYVHHRDGHRTTVTEIEDSGTPLIDGTPRWIGHRRDGMEAEWMKEQDFLREYRPSPTHGLRQPPAQ